MNRDGNQISRAPSHQAGARSRVLAPQRDRREWPVRPTVSVAWHSQELKSRKPSNKHQSISHRLSGQTSQVQVAEPAFVSISSLTLHERRHLSEFASSEDWAMEALMGLRAFCVVILSYLWLIPQTQSVWRKQKQICTEHAHLPRPHHFLNNIAQPPYCYRISLW